MNIYYEMNSQTLTSSQVENMSDSEKPLSDDAEAFLNQSLQNSSGFQGFDPSFSNYDDFLATWNSQSQENIDLLKNEQPQNSECQDLLQFVIPGQDGIGPLIIQTTLPPVVGNASQVKSEFAENLQLSQSSVTSHDDGIPSIERWPGPYNFAFSLEQGTTRKFNFSTSGNKLFCLPNHEIEFFFKYDFDKCKASDMFVRGFLRYSKSDSAAIPVLRCITHQTEDEQKLKDNKVTSAESFAEVTHVLKCTSKKAVYLQDEATNRRSVKVPMGSPQPGSGHISKLFKFDCLSSCKRSSLPKKCPITAVFELREINKVVGRVSFNLRVCSCPARDFVKEEPESNSAKVLGEGKRRKSDGPSPKAKVNLQKRIGGLDDDPTLNGAEKSKKLRISEPGLVTPKIELPDPPIVIHEDPFLSSSQESQASDDDGYQAIPAASRGNYKEMTKFAKFLLKKAYSPDPLMQFIGKNFAREIRKNLRTINKINQTRSMDQLEIPVERDGTAPNGSPDSGVNE